ncbi:MAG: hypothetical protein CMH36_07390 [Microbacterium sp.]|uniref:Uncharacterized protein n=1 Tax=Microbacterium ginsengisoli TaxID=400772 RepID=A0A3C1K9T5_9MICO|nr:hypothetical protein [uncultured Microbacterium sp.]MAL06633.1 hypothetical protein [Microbacterium sp.]HAN23429.1 hypothetical protein [Microbacterium ginsengisoli]
MVGLNAMRIAMRDRLEKAWDGLSGRYEDPPEWLDRLALQLELWVGDELDDALHIQIGYDLPPAESPPFHKRQVLEVNALNSETLYLRALTKSYFVDVEVQKVVGERKQVTTNIHVVPRDRLRKLAAEEITLRGPKPDAIRLRMSYAGAGEYLIPRDVQGDDEAWRTGGGVDLFRELRGDLWLPVVTDSKADVRI